MQRFRGLHASEAFAEAFAADQALAKAALDGSSRALRELLERLIDRAWWLADLGWVSPLPQLFPQTSTISKDQTQQPTSSPRASHCSPSGNILYFSLLVLVY